MPSTDQTDTVRTFVRPVDHEALRLERARAKANRRLLKCRPALDAMPDGAVCLCWGISGDKLDPHHRFI